MTRGAPARTERVALHEATAMRNLGCRAAAYLNPVLVPNSITLRKRRLPQVLAWDRRGDRYQSGGLAHLVIGNRSPIYRILRRRRTRFVERWYSVPTSPDRAAHYSDQGAIVMELIAAIAMFGVVLVIVGVAFDAARRAK